MATNTQQEGGITTVIRARKRTEGVFDVLMTVGNDDPALIGRIERYERPYYLDGDHSLSRGWKVIDDDEYYRGVAETKAEAIVWLANRAGVDFVQADGARATGIVR